MIEISVDTSGLTRMERSLMLLANTQMPFATARALNDCARAASVDVNAAMDSIFDRPTPFTEHAAVAPRSLAATKESLVATVTLRDVQAKYLAPEELGGTRTPDQASALVLPGKSLDLNQYGNIPTGTLNKFRSESKQNQRARRKRLLRAAYKKAGKGFVGPVELPPDAGAVVFLAKNIAANKAAIGGYFRRLAGGHLTRLTAFEPETHYHARMGYHARVQRVCAATWVAQLPRRLAEAIASAR